MTDTEIAALWALLVRPRPDPTHLIDGVYWYSVKDEVKPEHGEALLLSGKFYHESGGIKLYVLEKCILATYDAEAGDFLFVPDKGAVEYWRPQPTEVEQNQERLSQLYA